MTNRDRLVLLLGSLYDLAYFPPGSLRSSKGLTPARKTPCPDCSLAGETVKGSGWVTDVFKRRRPCLTCGGQREPSKAGGWAEKDKGRGWVKVDGMDAERAPVQSVDAAAAPTKAPRMVSCDACGGSGVGGAHLDENQREYRDPCRYCNGSGKRAAIELKAWTAAEERESSGDPLADHVDRMAARNESGSYLELEAAMRGLVRTINKPPPFTSLNRPETAAWANRLVWELHVSQLRTKPLSVREAELVELALGYLELRMPETIRVPSAVVQADKRIKAHRTKAKGRWAGPALKKRDAEIKRHAKDGRGPQWIAAEYGLHIATVYEVINGKREDAA